MIRLSDIRFTNPDQLLFQEQALNAFKNGLDRDRRVFLLHGPSGTGKTSLAKIYAVKLALAEGQQVLQDCEEINCADKGGADRIRELIELFQYAPLIDRARVFILDEAQHLSKAAQTSMMNALESLPATTYVFICTMDKSSLHEALVSRSVSVPFQSFNQKAYRNLVSDNKIKETRETKEALGACGGNYRRFLEILDGEEVPESDLKRQAAEFITLVHEWDPEFVSDLNDSVSDVKAFYYQCLALCTETISHMEGVSKGGKISEWLSQEVTVSFMYLIHDALLSYHQYSAISYPSQFLSMLFHVRYKVNEG